MSILNVDSCYHLMPAQYFTDCQALSHNCHISSVDSTALSMAGYGVNDFSEMTLRTWAVGSVMVSTDCHEAVGRGR